MDLAAPVQDEQDSPGDPVFLNGLGDSSIQFSRGRKSTLGRR
jgi:hypothetical protein